MGLGNTAKRLQKVANAAEELYAKMNEVIGKLNDLRDEVERTSEQVDRLEHDVARQNALLDAIAEAEGIDVDAVLAEADLPPAPEQGEDADGKAGDTVNEEDEAAADASDGEASSGA